MKHPGVKECAVLGIPHALYGEDVAAVVRLTPGSDSAVVLAELRERCREELSSVSRPAQILEIGELPKTTTGKIQKARIRDLLIHKLGLSHLNLFEAPAAASEKFSQDVIMFPASNGMLCCNVRAKTFVQISFSLFSALTAGGQPTDLWAKDCSTFSNAEGLLEDPTRLNRNADKVPPKTFATVDGARQFLTSRFILAGEAAAYRAYFSHKSGPLDHRHFGTFHQQLGIELLLKRRVDPNQWWYSQKFESESSELRNGLYKYVQQHFITAYFADKDFSGKRILDFGCGSGYGSHAFIQRGASVVGLEPDQTLLKRAQSELGDNFHGFPLDLKSQRPLADLQSDSFDFVWMSDVLLFYFYAMNPVNPSPVSAVELLSEIHRVLKLGGICTIMQSHGVFWLAPWFGSEILPFTVLTEYSDKLYSVAPGLEEMSSAIAEAGFLIRRIWEPKPAEAAEQEVSRAAFFAKQFPQWWVFELVK
jgi:SAM-dependent methyltransferase